MMNRGMAIAYGKSIGVRYYVKNQHGGLYGGFKDRKSALECKKKFEEDDKTNPWTKGTTKFFITMNP